jgi:CDP-paratose 2-epimerase
LLRGNLSSLHSRRAIFFGKNGDTRWKQKELSLKNNFTHELDIRDRVKINLLIKEIRPKCIVHTAAQPSHDLAASIPFDDFDINAVGTLNLLESCRQYCKDSPFIHMSTNKVYGDLPNSIKYLKFGS